LNKIADNLIYKKVSEGLFGENVHMCKILAPKNGKIKRKGAKAQINML